MIKLKIVLLILFLLNVLRAEDVPQENQTQDQPEGEAPTIASEGENNEEAAPKPEEEEFNEEKMKEQMEKMKEMLKGKDMEALMKQLNDIKNMTCLRETDNLLNENVEQLNQLGSDGHIRRMVKKLRAQIFGFCINKIDYKDLKKT